MDELPEDFLDQPEAGVILEANDYNVIISSLKDLNLDPTDADDAATMMSAIRFFEEASVAMTILGMMNRGLTTIGGFDEKTGNPIFTATEAGIAAVEEHNDEKDDDEDNDIGFNPPNRLGTS